MSAWNKKKNFNHVILNNAVENKYINRSCIAAYKENFYNTLHCLTNYHYHHHYASKLSAVTISVHFPWANEFAPW